MPYTAELGLGTVLRISIASVMTDIPYVQSITGPGTAFDIVDVTTHSSTGGFREFISGLADGGEITATINWHTDETTHQALFDAQYNREVTAFQLSWSALPDFATDNLFDFDGFVTGLPFTSPTDAQVTADLTIKITGPVDVSTE